MTTASENAIFIIGTVIIVAVFVVLIVRFVRNAARITRASDARLAIDIASLAPPAGGTAPQVPASSTGSSIAWDNLPWSEPQAAAEPVADATASTIESKLAELSALHARKLITDEELATARAKVLAE